MTGLLTDLYELTMAAGYFEAGKAAVTATFELSVRRLPKQRDYVLLAGLEQALDYLLRVRFSGEEIAYLRALPQFERAGPGFFEQLREFRFTGDVWAAPEGTVLFAGEPMLRVTAPLMEAQIPETYLLSTLTFQTLIATKASRMARAAGGRGVVEFGTRRAHTPEAGVLGGRAAYIGGCIGTSNTLSGFRFGVPVMGTCAHSWVMSFRSEKEAFRKLQDVLGTQTVQLVDTYDTAEGTRRAAELGRPLWGIRLDSGDFLSLSKQARAILDIAGLPDAKIMVSGDLDEWRIAELVAAGAPIDAFGVGTELATSGDAPSMGTIYKLVEIDGRDTAKWSQDKISWPGAKQLFRFPDRDVLALAEESCPQGAEPLLRPVILKGQLIAAAPSLNAIRDRAAESLRLCAAAPREVAHSSVLLALMDRLKAEKKMKTVFFDIDTQIDFLFPAGALYVPGAERLLPLISRLNQQAEAVVSTMCAHEENDEEFRQWPPHCVVGTTGQLKPQSTLLAERSVVPNGSCDISLARQIILEKQQLNLFTNPNLSGLLDALQADAYVVYGVVTEYCVGFAALGLLDTGKPVTLLTDAIQCLCEEDAARTFQDFAAKGGRLATSSKLLPSL